MIPWHGNTKFLKRFKLLLAARQAGNSKSTTYEIITVLDELLKSEAYFTKRKARTSQVIDIDH